MKKINFVLSSILLSFLIAINPALASDVSPIQTSLLSLPNDLIKNVGEMSGNTLALKATCSRLKNIEFKTKRGFIVLRYSEGFQSGLLTVPSGKPVFSKMGMWDDVRTLNCYNLTKEDFALLFPNAESVGLTLAALRGNPQAPIKRLIIRKGGKWRDYLAIGADIKGALANSGVDLRFVEDDSLVQIDKFFTRTRLDQEMLVGLLRMTSFELDIETYADRFANGEIGRLCFGQYIDWNNLTKDPEYLRHILKAHSEIMAKGGQTMLLPNFDCDPRPYIWGLFRTERHENGAEILNLIRELHLQQLLFGSWLFVNHLDGKRRLCDTLHLICHAETANILQLLRKFIPSYAPEDYMVAPGKIFHGALKSERYDSDSGYSRLYPNIKRSGLSRRETRNSICAGFLSALTFFPKADQYERLRRLIMILKIGHLAQIDNADDDSIIISAGFGFSSCIKNALGFVFDLTRDMRKFVLYDFVAFLKKEYENYNPLYPTSEEQFKGILLSYERAERLNK